MDGFTSRQLSWDSHGEIRDARLQDDLPPELLTRKRRWLCESLLVDLVYRASFWTRLSMSHHTTLLVVLSHPTLSAFRLCLLSLSVCKHPYSCGDIVIRLHHISGSIETVQQTKGKHDLDKPLRPCHAASPRNGTSSHILPACIISGCLLVSSTVLHTANPTPSQLGLGPELAPNCLSSCLLSSTSALCGLAHHHSRALGSKTGRLCCTAGGRPASPRL